MRAFMHKHVFPCVPGRTWGHLWVGGAWAGGRAGGGAVCVCEGEGLNAHGWPSTVALGVGAYVEYWYVGICGGGVWSTTVLMRHGLAILAFGFFRGG